MECVWCLLLMGHLQYQNRNQLQLSGCGQRLTTVDDTASPRRPAEASTLDANEGVIYLKMITQLVLSQILCNE